MRISELSEKIRLKRCCTADNAENLMANGSRRMPPCDNEAEASVLGSILLKPEVIKIVETVIEPEDFYSETHRYVYEGMLALEKENVPVDHVTLAHKLRQRGNLERIGGGIALSNLTDAVATTENVEHYAAIVYEKSAARKVIYAAQEVVSRGYMDTSSEELYGAVDSLTDKALTLARSRMPMSLLGMGEEVIEFYKKVAGGYRGIELPWPTINNMTAGMWPGTMTIFVARPGIGKSTVAILSARHAWLNGQPSLVVSPEMSKMEIAERFFVIDAGVSYKNTVRGELSAYELPKLENSASENKEKTGLWIMDSTDDLTPRGINSAIRACQPSFVAVDSMYDLRLKGDRKDKILQALEWLKSSSKEMNFAACGFAQQNRVAELSEKKGGGSRIGTIALADEVGQDAHAVFALEQTKDMKADGIMRIKPLKLRRGYGADPVDVLWNFDQMNFDEIPKDEESNDDLEEIPF